MVSGSFRLLARAGLPLALLFILAGCGGSTKREPLSSRVVSGPGFTVAVRRGWTVRKTPKSLVAARPGALVSVTRYTLLKTYDPAKFEAVSKELDRVAAELAAKGGGRLTERATTDVDGRRVRAYRFEAHGTPTRLGFVLADKQEYQLMCSGDTGAPCDLLFSTFRTG
jgi:hypothetical protein